MAEEKKITPVLTICGQTGAGKSSLINALMKASIQDVGITPTTQKNTEVSLALEGIPVFLMDTPGIGEACSDEAYVENLKAVLPETDLLLWVVGYDNRALDRDVRVLKEIHATDPSKPVLLLASAVDRVSRSFDARTFDPDSGTGEAEEQVRSWIGFLRETFADCHLADVIACSAGASFDDTVHQYNLPRVSTAIENLLPQVMRMRWLCYERVTKNRDEKARKMILGASATAGAIGLLPLPIADMPFIIATQVALILSLCSIYGRAFTADAAKSLSLAAISAVAGPLAFQAISKFIPGFGSLVGMGVASGCTYAVGRVTQTMLDLGEDITVDAFRKAVKETFAQYRKEKEREKRMEQEKKKDQENA